MTKTFVYVFSTFENIPMENKLRCNLFHAQIMDVFFLCVSSKEENI